MMLAGAIRDNCTLSRGPYLLWKARAVARHALIRRRPQQGFHLGIQFAATFSAS